MQPIDLLIHDAKQIVTCAGSAEPVRGQALADVHILNNASIAIDGERIVAVGNSAEITQHYKATKKINANGKTIIPGFVDSHTHVVFGGNRVHEFEMRIQGASYMEIMAAGGGIVSTMQHTRDASLEALVASARQRLDIMLSLGSTTIEVKTGYGLDTATELKMLHAIEALDQSHPCTLVPTFLGAHTLPPEYKENPEGYVNLVVDEMIPAVADWFAGSHFAQTGTPLFIDVFCEDHAFDVAQTVRILQAGIDAGMRPKIHVDQFNELGALEASIELGAISADHLEVTGEAGIAALAASNTMASIVPMANFNLGIFAYAPGRALADAGAAITLATDMNPGSAPAFSMPLTMAVACRNMRLLPAEALNASTINGAHAIGMADTIGSIEVGKQADLLILDTNDYRTLTYLLGHNPVETIIKNGQIVA